MSPAPFLLLGSYFAFTFETSSLTDLFFISLVNLPFPWELVFSLVGWLNCIDCLLGCFWKDIVIDCSEVFQSQVCGEQKGIHRSAQRLPGTTLRRLCYRTFSIGEGAIWIHGCPYSGWLARWALLSASFR